jgi:spermidine synthase
VRTVLLYFLFLFSGAAGLIYELVWVRELIFVFGGTTYAITTVLVAFMAGLGLGSFLAGRWCYRLHRPGRVYGALEIAIGLYALSVPLLLNVAEPMYRSLYPHLAGMPWLLNLVRFCVGGLVLVVPTTFMGATLPVLVRYLTLRGRALGRSVGHLYGINTFGAVLGTVSAGFWLIPTLGLTHSTWLAATINVLIGLTALGLLRHAVTPAPLKKAPSKPRRPAEPTSPPLPVTQLQRIRPAILAGFAVSGFAAMVYQITWTRALVMSVGSTTYSFTCILAAFILGLALGSLAIARWVDRWKNPARVFGVLEIIIGLVAVLIVPIHGQVPLIVQSLVSAHYYDYLTLMSWQFALIIAVTFVPTFLMGAIFPLVTRALAVAGDEPGAATGRAYAVNTIGTITGSFLAGFALIRSDVLGVQNSIILASLLNGAVGLTLVVLAPPAAGRTLLRRALVPTAALLLIPIVACAAGRWDRNILTLAPFLNRGAEAPQREILHYAEGVDLTVVVEHPPGQPQALTITINGKPDASTNIVDVTTNLLLAHLPALLAPEARTACMVGLGSGLSLGALSRHSSFERIDCVEISSDVVEAAAHFASFNYKVLTDDPRVSLILADGRNHLLLTDRTYDLIITQPPNPWVSGVSNLFTREYFELGRRRLSDRGLMAAWLQGYKMSVADFQMVVRTLFEVFEHVSLWELGEDDFLMITSRQPQKIALDEFVRRLRVPTVRADLYRVGIRRPEQILGRYITSDEPLRAWVAAAPVHTDDNALLEFSAPRHMYVGTRQVAQALFGLQRPVLPDLLAASELPREETLDGQVTAVVESRRARIPADDLAARGDVAGALRLLLDVYVRGPDNAELYRFITESRRNVLAVPGLAARPEIAALLAQVERLPPPRGAPLTGATLAEIAASLRAVARYAAGRGQWSEAAEYLLEAKDLDPDNLVGARDLAEALTQAGRNGEAAAVLNELLQRHPEDGPASYARAVLAVQANDPNTALMHLATALKTGAATREKLAADEKLGPLREDPRFQAMLGRPETAPGNPSYP